MHFPQEAKERSTESPGLAVVTLEPVSRTIPAPSWPKTRSQMPPMNGEEAAMRSEWHNPTATILTMSSSSWIGLRVKVSIAQLCWPSSPEGLQTIACVDFGVIVGRDA